MYDIKAAVQRLQVTADAKSTTMMRVQNALEAAGVKFRASSHGLLLEPGSSQLAVLKAIRGTGLHDMGKQTRGNYSFNYNKTSKDLGWVDYWPKRDRIDFD